MTRPGRWLSPGVRFDEGAAEWRCARCGYACRQHASGPCSECGADVDPVTRRGLRSSLPAPLLRAAMRAPGLPMLACGLAAAGVWAWARSVPTGDFGWELVAAAALVLLAGIYLLRMLWAGFASNRYGRLGDCARQPGWWAVPVASIAAVTVALSPLPLHAGFWVRRGELDALAALWTAGDLDGLRARSDAVSAGRGLRVLFDADGRPQEPKDLGSGMLRPLIRAGAEAEWRGFAVEIPETGFIFETGGYIYLPDLPVDTTPANNGFSPLGGGWWQGIVWRD